MFAALVEINRPPVTEETFRAYMSFVTLTTIVILVAIVYVIKLLWQSREQKNDIARDLGTIAAIVREQVGTTHQLLTSVEAYSHLTEEARNVVADFIGKHDGQAPKVMPAVVVAPSGTGLTVPTPQKQKDGGSESIV